LRKNKIVEKDKKTYSLVGFELLSPQEINDLIELCDKRLNDFIEKRGKQVFEHRKKNRRPVPGSVRYEVLKRAKGRCELCGISMEQKAIEVDHITQKNKGGKDTIDNYQALCYSCNANKRDLDNTDFRDLNATYDLMDSSCVMCNIPSERIIAESELTYAVYDKFPVTEGHVLIMPKRHCSDYFELAQPEVNSIRRLAHTCREILIKKDPSITGFNIGFNAGADAGQTIFHAHMHIIPRRHEDVANPKGGIRNVIQGKGDYTSS
jgi:diadenosine tetraphosphate (Ap4A) HIT family hydrolase